MYIIYYILQKNELRIDRTWISTVSTLTDFDTATDPKFLLLSGGCPTVPCWATISNSGLQLDFYAVKFASSGSIYLYSEIYLCPIGTSCDVSSTCTTCSGANTFTPTGRRRRSDDVSKT